jgi:hypothetical protein
LLSKISRGFTLNILSGIRKFIQNPPMSDINHYMSQGFSREEAKAQVAADHASTGLMIAVFRLFFHAIVLFFLFLPGIFCAYLLLTWLKKPIGDPHGWDYFWWMLGIVYLLECLVFFLKGWHLRLKDRDNLLWMLLWLICILYCFALPVLMMHEFILGQVRHHPAQDLSTRGMIIIWVAAVVTAGLIFWRYRLHKDTAPPLFRWAYRLGRGSR